MRGQIEAAMSRCEQSFPVNDTWPDAVFREFPRFIPEVLSVG
jgi:hypothetical protein